MSKKHSDDNIEITASSGNVFNDLGITNAEDYHAKVHLAQQINHIIQERNLKQVEAAALLGVDQPKISVLSRGQLSQFSLARLIQFLNLLDQDVKIIVKPKPKKRLDHGHLSVAFS